VGDDIRALQDLDLLPDDIEPDDVSGTDGAQDGTAAIPKSHPATKDQSVTRQSHRHGRTGDIDWFEEMLIGSRLGRTQRMRRGIGTSTDGSVMVQWEVSEYREGESEPSTPTTSASKRKIGEVGENDVSMRG
jgi:hypothetical protein